MKSLLTLTDWLTRIHFHCEKIKEENQQLKIKLNVLQDFIKSLEFNESDFANLRNQVEETCRLTGVKNPWGES